MSTSITNQTQRQIMMSFAYLAYCGSAITTPSPESEILGYIDAAMPQIPPIAAPNPTWQVVWGPAVYTVPGALSQDNMMFVAQSRSDPTQYAVAVRGTSGDLDWLLEDFDIFDRMIWPPGASTSSPAGAMMSESTSIALQILLSMESGGQSLMAFLTSSAKSAINVCVTGHSLGGCLASTLALYLIEQQATWDGSSASTVSTITFAAPTAGNAAFAAHSDATFTGAKAPPGWDPSLGTNCDPVRCTLDVAPLAWVPGDVWTASSGASPLFLIYAPPNVPSAPNIDFSTLQGISSLAWSAVKSDILPKAASVLATPGYTQIQSAAAPLAFPGGFHGSGVTKTGTLVEFLEAFVAEAKYQHGSSYPSALGVPSLLDATIIVRSSARPTSAR